MDKSLGAQMEREIRQQPELLANALPSYRRFFEHNFPSESFDLAILAARGTSDHCALYLRYLIEVFAEIPVSMAAPSVLTYFESNIRYTNVLGVGISQSGAAPDVAAVLAAIKEQNNPTVAITNSENSLVGDTAMYHCQLGVGEESAIAATKTFTASLLASYCLAERLCDLPRILLPAQSDLENAIAQADEVANQIVQSPLVICLGRGFAFPSALECALKLIECALVPAKCYSTADFEHGPKALLDKKTTVICFSNAPDSAVSSGANIIQAPSMLSETGSNASKNLSSTLFAALFSQSLALAAARHKGINPDFARNLSKVTRTM